MITSVKIDYLGHSGFYVELDSVMLLFDYCRGDLSFVKDRPDDKPLYVFVSHSHSDHFNPKIFSLTDIHPLTRYILSFDIDGDPAVPQDRDIMYMDADMTYDVAGLGTVQTLLSTDEGVAFLVTASGITIFHAGDLHWWDWPGEDPEWLAEQEAVFRREISCIEGIPIDVAFAVLDDRLEGNYAKGMEQLISRCKPKYVLPMHFWNDRSVVERFRSLLCRTETEMVLLDTAEETHWEL